jgi:hypothetical protein
VSRSISATSEPLQKKKQGAGFTIASIFVTAAGEKALSDDALAEGIVDNGLQSLVQQLVLINKYF